MASMVTLALELALPPVSTALNLFAYIALEPISETESVATGASRFECAHPKLSPVAPY